MVRGALIVFEGIDRTGKSTQSAKLVEALKTINLNAERLNFPNRTTNTGQLISKYLSNKDCHINDETVHLLFSANRWENVENIRSKLQMGTSLIVDRYSYSGIAYSVAKGLDSVWCMQPEIGLPQPDLVFFLDINAEDLLLRSGFGRERYENLSMQDKVSKIFKQFATTENYWKTVDASKSLDEIHQIVLKETKKTLKDIELDNRPLSTIRQLKLKENGLHAKTNTFSTII